MSGLDGVAFGQVPLPIVLFDANVLFQAATTRFLLGAAQAGAFRAVWTDEIAEEARRNLISSSRAGALAAFEQNCGLVRDPLVPAGAGDWLRRLSRTDSKDRHVLAAAGRNGVQVIVTDNVRDFDRDEARDFGVVLVSARDFAAHLSTTHPEALVRHIERVPPDRFDRYVARLEQLLPEAMATLAPLLRD